MTPDLAAHIIERGDNAARLLADPNFVWIVDDQTNLHLAALCAAPPGPKGSEAVQYHHQMQHTLTELIASLRGYAEAGEAMRNALAQDADEDNFPVI